MICETVEAFPVCTTVKCLHSDTPQKRGKGKEPQTAVVERGGV